MSPGHSQPRPPAGSDELTLLPPALSNSSVAGVLLSGCILFLAAAFNPSAMAFGATGAEAKLRIIEEHRGLWLLSQYGFGVGAVVTASGFVLLASAHAGGNRLVGLVSYAMLIGALLWGINLVLRASDVEGFATGTHPRWPFLVYTLLTILGLAEWGWFYLQTGFPNWLGWATLIPILILFILLIVLGDMPPFVYYLITLLTVWVLFRQAP